MVVIGGGLAGAAVALSLAARGVWVTLVDAQRPGCAATGAAAGMLAPQYESEGPGPLFDVLCQARDQYATFVQTVESLTQESIHLGWEGMLVANLTEAEHIAAQDTVAWQRAAGAEIELVETDEALRLQAGLTPHARSWLWLPREGQIDPQRLVGMLPLALGRAGVQVRNGRGVSEIRTGHDRVEGVLLDADRFIPADAVVLAAGAWSNTLRNLPRDITVRPIRGHMLRYPAGSVPFTRLVAGHAGRYLVPRHDGTLLAGSTMDDNGFDRSLDDDCLAEIHAAAARLAPALEKTRPAEQWADLRPIPVDGRPVIGADPQVKGLFYATGYGRNGILLSPLAGSVVADLVLGGDLPPGWDSFSPGRFQPTPS